MLKTPVLFIIFNRLDTTKIVFEKIKQIQPKYLFIAADGPRNSHKTDAENCSECREWVLQQVDWECELKTLFRTENYGCGQAVSTSITWFFDHVEQGIILEDDCLPSEDFFQFCEELLDYYKNDNRIMHIGGCNHGINDPDSSYFFSHMAHIWGWATWKRAWKHFDLNMDSWVKFNEKDYINWVYSYSNEAKRRYKNWQKTVSGTIDCWGYQWAYAVTINGGLSILPGKNLIKNIGFNSEATHTNFQFSYDSKLELLECSFPLKHPPFFIPRTDLDISYTELQGLGNGRHWFETTMFKLAHGFKKLVRVMKSI